MRAKTNGWTIRCLVSTLPAILFASVGGAQEIQVVPAKGKEPQVKVLVKARPDFGPPQDGKAASHGKLIRQGWVYLFDSRIPKKDPRWDPLGLWRPRNAKNPQLNRWKVFDEDGQLVLKNDIQPNTHGTDLISLQEFWNFDLHAEVRVSSNSGLYLRGRYEIQINTPRDEKPGRGDLGAIYGVRAPLVNAGKPRAEWQTIDATIRGFRISLWLNGKLIQDDVEIPENKRHGTGSELREGDGVSSDPQTPGPFFVQGDHGTVELRNIRVRPVSTPMPAVRVRAVEGKVQPRVLKRNLRVEEVKEKKD